MTMHRVSFILFEDYSRPGNHMDDVSCNLWYNSYTFLIREKHMSKLCLLCGILFSSVMKKYKRSFFFKCSTFCICPSLQILYFAKGNGHLIALAPWLPDFAWHLMWNLSLKINLTRHRRSLSVLYWNVQLTLMEF